MSALFLPQGVPVRDMADPVGILRAAGIVMSEEDERLDAIARAQFVLVRIDGTGERWRCSRCGSKHAHFTTFCVERPFKGLRSGLMAYWQNTAVADRDLSPDQLRRRHEIGRLMGFADGLPALADAHPRTAQVLATPGTDIDLGAWVLGTIDPIVPQRAAALVARINARAGRTAIWL